MPRFPDDQVKQAAATAKSRAAARAALQRRADELAEDAATQAEFNEFVSKYGKAGMTIFTCRRGARRHG